MAAGITGVPAATGAYRISVSHQLLLTKAVAFADPTEVAAELDSIGETVEFLKQM